MKNRAEQIISRYSLSVRMIDARLIRFILVGCSNFVVSLLTFEAFLKATNNFPMRVAAAQVISYSAGLVWSFIWNRKYTFCSSGPWGNQFLRFLVIQLSLAGGSALTIWLIVDFLFHLDPTLGWFIVMGVVTLLNFYLSRKYVFMS